VNHLRNRPTHTKNGRPGRPYRVDLDMLSLSSWDRAVLAVGLNLASAAIGVAGWLDRGHPTRRSLSVPRATGGPVTYPGRTESKATTGFGRSVDLAPQSADVSTPSRSRGVPDGRLS
jgi:hypothetical protein